MFVAQSNKAAARLKLHTTPFFDWPKKRLHARCILTRCSRCVLYLFKRYLEAELYCNPTTLYMEFSLKTSKEIMPKFLCYNCQKVDIKLVLRWGKKPPTFSTVLLQCMIIQHVHAGCMYSMHTLNVTRFWKISLNVTLKYMELHNLLWQQQKDHRTFKSIFNYFLVIQGGNYKF